MCNPCRHNKSWGVFPPFLHYVWSRELEEPWGSLGQWAASASSLPSSRPQVPLLLFDGRRSGSEGRVQEATQAVGRPTRRAWASWCATKWTSSATPPSRTSSPSPWLRLEAERGEKEQELRVGSGKRVLVLVVLPLLALPQVPLLPPDAGARRSRLPPEPLRPHRCSAPRSLQLLSPLQLFPIPTLSHGRLGAARLPAGVRRGERLGGARPPQLLQPLPGSQEAARVPGGERLTWPRVASKRPRLLPELPAGRLALPVGDLQAPLPTHHSQDHLLQVGREPVSRQPGQLAGRRG